MTTVTLTVDQLQDLLQKQTSSLEQLMTTQIALLQTKLETSLDVKLQAKFDEAEMNVKQFVKESIDDDDDDDDDVNNDNDNDDNNGKGDDKVVKEKQAVNYEGIIETFHQLCERLETSMDEKIDQIMMKQNAAAAAAATTTNFSSTTTTSDHQSISDGANSNNAQQQQQQQVLLETTLTRRMELVEQFIDARMAEHEAFYSSASARLQKDVLEAIQDAWVRHYNNKAVRGVTKEELEAILDARIDALSDDDDDDDKDDKDDNAEEKEGDKNISRSGSASNLKTTLKSASLAAAVTSPKRNHGTANANTKALQQLLQQQKEWIDLQNSTSDLELQVQRKLQVLEDEEKQQQGITGVRGTNNSTMASLGTVLAKLNSLERVILNSTKTNNNITRTEPHPATTITSKVLSAGNNSKEGNGTNRRRHQKQDNSCMEDSSKSKTAASVSNIAEQMMGGSSKQSNNEDSSSNNNSNTNKTRLSKLKNRHQARSLSTDDDVDDAYLDVSLDENQARNAGHDDDDEEEEEEEVADVDNADDYNEKEHGDTKRGGQKEKGAVKSFMSTLDNWRDLESKKDHNPEIDGDDGDDINNIDEGDVEISDSDKEEDDNDVSIDEQNSHETLSVDGDIDEKESDVELGGDNNNIDEGKDDNEEKNASDDEEEDNAIVNKAVMRVLRQLETKLGRVEEHVQNMAKQLTFDEIEEMVTNANDTLKSDLKEWMLEQQEYIVQQQSESGQATGEATTSAGMVLHEDLEQIRDKLFSIEEALAANTVLLEKSNEEVEEAVPEELPLLTDTMMSSSIPTAELEEKILRHLDTMDKSVQFKLDEIFSELQNDSAISKRKTLSSLSEDDRIAVTNALQAHLQGLQSAIVAQLKESIPDYGMAKSLISENLEEIRQVVSEVAISEVELLKTQLNVAEKAEQEALHAINVLQTELEQAKENERRLMYNRMSSVPSQQPGQDNTGGLFNFGGLAGALTGAPTGLRSNRTSRRMSMESHLSALSDPKSTNRGSGLGFLTPAYGRKSLAAAKKLETWKAQFAQLEDKSTDLRTLYSQLRQHGIEQWSAEESSQAENMPFQARATTATPPPVKSSLRPNNRYSAGEVKLEEELSEGDWN